MVIFGLFTLFALFGTVLATGSRTQRSEVLQEVTVAWSDQEAIARLKRCLSEHHRRLTLLVQSYGGLDGDAIDASVRVEFAKEISACVSLANSLSEDWLQRYAPQLKSDTRTLEQDWSYVLKNLGVRHVDAVTRQVTRADPKVLELLTEVIPKAQDSERVRIARRYRSLAEIGARSDGFLIAAMAFPLISLGLLAFILLRRVLNTLLILTDGMVKLGHGDLEHRVEVDGADELTQFAVQVNAMADALLQSRRELDERADELEASLNALRGAQQQIVQQEKLAALGELVAGIAHEVNTPLGVAVTSGSLIEEGIRGLKMHSEHGTATRRILREAVADLEAASHPLRENLFRAAELVRSFRQVAVDRHSVATRTVRLSNWAKEIELSLAPLLRSRRIELENSVEDSTRISVEAGELGQIATNLIVNASLHAYPEPSDDPTQQHPVRLAAWLEHDALMITVADSGCGMSAETAARVFEPFFTTRRGSGGSGLGMHIVHQLVTSRFGGTIRLSTGLGEGTMWTVRLPLGSAALHLRDEPERA